MSNVETFADIAGLEDSVIQVLLRKTEIEDYLTGLRDVEDAVKQALFRNMSERVRQFIQEEIDFRKNVDESSINEARARILAVAQTVA